MVSFKDNDGLAARLSVEMSADLLIILSDVDGMYDKPPETDGSRLVKTFSPKVDLENIMFKGKSKVGLGGMEAKVWSLPFTLLQKCEFKLEAFLHDI